MLAKEQWRILPVDDIGYLSIDELQAKSDTELKELIDRMAHNRNTGWRNYQNLWVEKMRTFDRPRTILDFGCGVGLEAVELSKLGHKVCLRDMNDDGVDLAERVMGLYGYSPYTEACEVFYANGVLHHCPDAQEVLQEADDSGFIEMRLMLYTEAIKDHTEVMDFPGAYVDWYTPEKLAGILPDGWNITDWTVITENQEYAAVRVEKQ